MTVLLYGCETWTLNKQIWDKVQVFPYAKSAQNPLCWVHIPTFRDDSMPCYLKTWRFMQSGEPNFANEAELHTASVTSK